MRDPEDALEREPTLDDVLSDPSVRALMTSDHVEAEHLRALLQRLRTQQTRRPPGEAKAAAAHDWMTSLHERGRALGLRYSARTGVVSG
ncbi:MAG TPA: hypothetical protein VKU84_10220 [Stellaceae bacterium]|nr:hypothetical protein [Stellaceae bacterium]